MTFSKYLLLAGLAACATIAPAHGQTAPANAAAAPAQYDTAVFAALPSVEGPELSPNGKMVAARIAVANKQYFALVAIDGSGQRLIPIDDVDLNWWYWVNDDWLALGVGQVLKVQGDDWYISRAAALNAATLKLLTLSNRESGQDADDLIWSASDGSARVLIASQTSIYSDRGGFWPKVEEVDLARNKRHTILDGREGVMDWYADASGVVRMGIGVTLDGRSRRLLYRNGDHDAFRVVDRARGIHDSLAVPAMFLPDRGKALAIQDDEKGFSSLYEFDLTTMQRGKQLFASPGYDIGSLVTDRSHARYLGVRVNEDRRRVRWSDPKMAALQQKLDGMIKGGQPEIVSFTDDLSVVLVQVGDATSPGGYFIYRAADDSMTMLGLNNEKIGLKRLHPVRTIRYKARDGLEIPAVLTLPAKDATNLPLIVMPHGGPAARDSEEWDWWAQFLADRGYAVVQPNYRGSTGYGTEFTAKGEGQWGLAMQDDLNDAVTELAAQKLIDPKRVCIVGASYGGYAALRAAQRDGTIYRCAVSYAGVSDLERMKRYNRRFLGGEVRKDWLKAQAPDFKAISPIYHAEDFSIPVLLLHGRKDRVVPFAQSKEMVERLKAAGKTVEFIDQREGDHHFTRGEDRLEFLNALEAFLAKYNPAS
ncbi:alpha/beta hydrolase family protein [Sphingomonas sp. RS6]